jgi:hypothetical protein
LKGTSVTEGLEAVNNLLQAVEKNRYDTASPARKIWRWLRDSPWSKGWLGWLMVRLQYAWDWFRGKLSDGEDFAQWFERLGRAHTLPAARTLEEAAARVLELDTQQQGEEERRGVSRGCAFSPRWWASRWLPPCEWTPFNCSNQSWAAPPAPSAA